MPDSQPPAPPPRQYKTRVGVRRKTAEERAASIQAEALRQADQIQPQPSHAPQDVVRRTGPVPRDTRTRNQNTGSVFSSTGGTSTRAKNTHGVSGIEELVQRAEGGEVVADEAETSRKVNDAMGAPKPLGATKKTPGRPARTTARKDEICYVADDEAPGSKEGNPVDIEDIDRISISSGEDDGAHGGILSSRRRQSTKTPKPNLGLRPVRAARNIYTTDEAGTQAYTPAQDKAKREKQIKFDPDHVDVMDLDEGDETVVAGTVKQTTPIPGDREALPTQSPTKRRRKSSTKDARPQYETAEERAERERYNIELRRLRNELCPISPEHPPKAPRGALHNHPPEESRLYLFQFPPLTPMLIHPSEPGAIKTEPTSDSAAAAAASEPQVKKADGGHTTPDPESAQLLTAANAATLPAGAAGKLHVHRSGRVTLEWGSTNATNLEVKWGSEVDFLQDVVLTSGDGGGQGGGRRKAWALKQVRNKFVVVPDWGKIYE